MRVTSSTKTKSLNTEFFDFENAVSNSIKPTEGFSLSDTSNLVQRNQQQSPHTPFLGSDVWMNTDSDVGQLDRASIVESITQQLLAQQPIASKNMTTPTSPKNQDKYPELRPNDSKSKVDEPSTNENTRIGPDSAVPTHSADPHLEIIIESDSRTSSSSEETDSENILDRDLKKARLYNEELTFMQYCHELNKYTGMIVWNDKGLFIMGAQ